MTLTDELLERIVKSELVLLIIKRVLALPNRLSPHLQNNKMTSLNIQMTSSHPFMIFLLTDLGVDMVVDPDEAIGVGVVHGETLGLNDLHQEAVVLG